MCEVTLNSNGGSRIQSNILVQYGDQIGELPEPEWNGHAFNGWLLPDGTFANESTVVKKDLTLVAMWQAFEYEVQYDMNGIGSVPDSAWRTYTNDMVASTPYTPPEPECDGYDFVEWNPRTIPLNSTGDVLFAASWKVA